MIAGNQMVHIDEDELLEELEMLKEQDRTVLADGVIKLDNEIIKLPSVPETEIKIKASEVDSREERETERVLIPE